MGINDIVLNITEIIGTVAFAISGALVAIGCSLDIFGVIFIGCITAVGGGILRDILIGQYPPAIFLNLDIFFIAVITSIVVFVIAYIKKKEFALLRDKVEKINNLFDAVGLAAFSVMGTEIVCSAGYEEHAVFAILLGMITGIGGGIFRDILTDTTPYVLKKHIYAVASLTGSTIYYVMEYLNILNAVSTVTAMIIVITIRMLAAKYRWQLPKIEL